VGLIGVCHMSYMAYGIWHRRGGFNRRFPYAYTAKIGVGLIDDCHIWHREGG
jgi:hypothetical protein